MASGGEILREWQRRFPGRFVDAHLSTLQSRLREIRASLLAVQAEQCADKVIQAGSSGSQTGPSKVPEASSQADTLPIVFPKPVPAASPEPEAAWPFSMPPTTEEELWSDRLPLVPSEAPASGGIGAYTGEGETGNQHVPIMLVPPDRCNGDGLFSSRMTIDQAMRAFLQGEHTHTWDPKTREWHETALGQLQRYLAWRGAILLKSLTSSELRGWLTFLRTESLATGAFRVNNTISTYARSVHTFCNWLVGQGYLEQTPFVSVKMPKATRRRLHLIEQETFERLLRASQVAGTKRAFLDHAAVRNHALLWVMWETGLLVSEVCTLDLGDVNLAQNTLSVQGTSSRGRSLPLTPCVQQALTVYLKQYRLRAGKSRTHDPFFLTEQRGRLTPNALTLLFARLNTRAGLGNKPVIPSMLRDMFAIRFLQTGGASKALQRLLGLAESTPIKRYQDAARLFPQKTPVSGISNDPLG